MAKDKTKETAILVLGLLVALLPFLGFPRSWKTIFFVLSGIAIASLAFLMRERREETPPRAERRTDVYVENGVAAGSRPKEFDSTHPKGFDAAHLKGFDAASPKRVEIRPHGEDRQQTP